MLIEKTTATWTDAMKSRTSIDGTIESVQQYLKSICGIAVDASEIRVEQIPKDQLGKSEYTTWHTHAVYVNRRIVAFTSGPIVEPKLSAMFTK